MRFSLWGLLFGSADSVVEETETDEADTNKRVARLFKKEKEHKAALERYKAAVLAKKQKEAETVITKQSMEAAEGTEESSSEEEAEEAAAEEEEEEKEEKEEEATEGPGKREDKSRKKAKKTKEETLELPVFNLKPRHYKAVRFYLERELKSADMKRVQTIYHAFDKSLVVANSQDYLVTKCRERTLELAKKEIFKTEEKADNESGVPASSVEATTPSPYINSLATLEAASDMFSPAHESWLPFRGIPSAARTSLEKEKTAFIAQKRQDKENGISQTLERELKPISDPGVLMELYAKHMSSSYVTARRYVSCLSDYYYPETRKKALNAFRQKALEFVKNAESNARETPHEGQPQPQSPAQVCNMIDVLLQFDLFSDRHNNKYGYFSTTAIDTTAKEELIKIKRRLSEEPLFAPAGVAEIR